MDIENAEIAFDDVDSRARARKKASRKIMIISLAILVAAIVVIVAYGLISSWLEGLWSTWPDPDLLLD